MPSGPTAASCCRIFWLALAAHLFGRRLALPYCAKAVGQPRSVLSSPDLAKPFRSSSEPLRRQQGASSSTCSTQAMPFSPCCAFLASSSYVRLIAWPLGFRDSVVIRRGYWPQRGRSLDKIGGSPALQSEKTSIASGPPAPGVLN